MCLSIVEQWGGPWRPLLEWNGVRTWRKGFRDEAVMERVIEYLGTVSVSRYSRGEKSLHVVTGDFHSLPSNPVISRRRHSEDGFLCMNVLKDGTGYSSLMCSFYRRTSSCERYIGLELHFQLQQ